jgi:predicted secreted protein
VSLLEKQNAKLDKHDERLKRLNEGFGQLKTETTRCTEGIEAFSKTMSKKLKTMSEL